MDRIVNYMIRNSQTIRDIVPNHQTKNEYLACTCKGNLNDPCYKCVRYTTDDSSLFMEKLRFHQQQKLKNLLCPCGAANRPVCSRCKFYLTVPCKNSDCHGCNQARLTTIYF